MTTTADDDIIGQLIQPNNGYYEACAWCHHEWHGLACRGLSLCRCDGAMRRPDDTWRPRADGSNLHRQLQIMHDTGVDGWTARLCTATNFPRSGLNTPLTLKCFLYGGAP